MYRPLMIVLTLLMASPALSANPMQPDQINVPPAPERKVATPTRPAVPTLPRLDSIVIVGSLRKAIFNGEQEIRLGESINGYRLIAVKPGSVTLQHGQLTRILTLTTPGDFQLTPATEE